MARFPSKESEVFALAQEMRAGLGANVAIYPSPPVRQWWIGWPGRSISTNTPATAGPGGRKKGLIAACLSLS